MTPVAIRGLHSSSPLARLTVLLGASLLLAHCSTGNNSGGLGSGAAPGTSGSGAGGSGAGGPDFIDPGVDSGGDNGSAGSGEPQPGGCGDGILHPSLGEACDDGNSEAEDGCSSDCVVVEQGWACLEPGMPCIYTVECGDGVLSGAETCDDGDVDSSDGCDAECLLEEGWTCAKPGSSCQAALCGDGIVAGAEQCEDDDSVPADGDGCSAECKVEAGWVCETEGAACREAVCGDGVAEGGEPCDDDNDVVGDGCSPLCEAEPICTRPSDPDGCSSSCGDGLILPNDDEDCDDGNKQDGDGCSATCEVEPGYECEVQQGELPGSVKIPFVFRDFIALPSNTTTKPRHPDFQAQCWGSVQEGMVNASLDSQGKPINSGTCNMDAECTLNYGPGYDDHCVAEESCGPAQGCGQLHGLHRPTGYPDEDPFRFWYRDTTGVNHTKFQAITLAGTAGKYQFNDNTLFPFDGDGWGASGDEVQKGGHNFGFTSEVRRWFEFHGGELLTFDGDDDVWVFINGKLALDLGGVHGAQARSIRLNADGTVDCKLGEPGDFDALTDCPLAQRDLELIVGSVYEIALFHAERHTDASNFRLALTGFVAAKSVCAPVCGDGVQTPDEECDDGDDNDDSAYGGCTTTCQRGAYCGDNTVQQGDEACDDGKNLTTYSSAAEPGCAPGCKHSAYCGDGQIDGIFGEQCDDGTNAGGYEGCDSDCTLGPRCGDGVIQTPEEQCDDDNTVNNDGCSAECDNEAPR